jgi:hypothetical protein
MTTQAVTHVITIHNPTVGQLDAITKILGATQDTGSATTVRTRKTTAPTPTVSDDEDEDFGKAAMSKDDIEEENTVDWDDLKMAINTYGEVKPEAMKAILLSFNVKNTKELQTVPNKWGAVYAKVLSKIKSSK